MPLRFSLAHLDRRSFLLAVLALAVAVLATLDRFPPSLALASGLGSFLLLAAGRCRDAGLSGRAALRILDPRQALGLAAALFLLPSAPRG